MASAFFFPDDQTASETAEAVTSTIGELKTSSARNRAPPPPLPSTTATVHSVASENLQAAKKKSRKEKRSVRGFATPSEPKKRPKINMCSGALFANGIEVGNLKMFSEIILKMVNDSTKDSSIDWLKVSTSMSHGLNRKTSGPMDFDWSPIVCEKVWTCVLS